MAPKAEISHDLSLAAIHRSSFWYKYRTQHKVFASEGLSYYCKLSGLLPRFLKNCRALDGSLAPAAQSTNVAAGHELNTMTCAFSRVGGGGGGIVLSAQAASH